MEPWKLSLHVPDYPTDAHELGHPESIKRCSRPDGELYALTWRTHPPGAPPTIHPYAVEIWYRAELDEARRFPTLEEIYWALDNLFPVGMVFSFATPFMNTDPETRAEQGGKLLSGVRLLQVGVAQGTPAARHQMLGG